MNAETTATLTSCAALLTEAAEYVSPTAALRMLHAVERKLDAARVQLVQTARADGSSWETIADALGTTRQAAHERYSRTMRPIIQANADQYN